MALELTTAEVRVLGCLIEKQITTPDYYPLTLNALRTACNQKSNRDPVVDFDEKTVVRTTDSLRDKKLAWMITGASARVPKYEHSLTKVIDLSPAEVAVLCVLMLRGPQTVGEIRGRTGRLHEFGSLEEVEAVLSGLMEREDQALVMQLPRQPGRKEGRYAHLLAGVPEVGEEEPEGDVRLEASRLEVQAENERIAALEEQVQSLRDDVTALREAFDTFRSQFE